MHPRGIPNSLFLLFSSLAYAGPAASAFASSLQPTHAATDTLPRPEASAPAAPYRQDSVSPLQDDLPVRLLGGEELTAAGVSVRVEAVQADQAVALSPMRLAFRLRADSATEIGSAGPVGLQAEIDYSRIARLLYLLRRVYQQWRLCMVAKMEGHADDHFR
ncbi:MAG: hypothetical protein KDD92_07980 [Caldilineaceae bacterium]|nr:hypothetical protein [Caldilineaceae bacterium]